MTLTRPTRVRGTATVLRAVARAADLRLLVALICGSLALALVVPAVADEARGLLGVVAAILAAATVAWAVGDPGGHALCVLPVSRRRRLEIQVGYGVVASAALWVVVLELLRRQQGGVDAGSLTRTWAASAGLALATALLVLSVDLALPPLAAGAGAAFFPPLIGGSVVAFLVSRTGLVLLALACLAALVAASREPLPR